MSMVLIIFMVWSMYAVFSTEAAFAFSGKVGSVYTVTDGGMIKYGEGEGGYSNSKKTDLDDGLGNRYSYCVQPDKPTPTAVRVTVDSVITDDADTGKWNAMRNIIFYSPSYPGYEDNVKNIRGNYYTGDFSKDWGIAHLALSYVYAGRPEDLATYGGTRASQLGEIWTKAKALGNALWRDGTSRDDAVPASFKVFISYMEGVQNMVVGYMETPGTLKITKSSAIDKITSGNGCYSLNGAEYSVFDTSNEKVGELKVGQSGISDALELPGGTYYVQETAAPPGYALDTEKHKVKVVSEEETEFTHSETPITALIDVLLVKTGEGNKALKNAVYRFEYFGTLTGVQNQGGTPIKVWYLFTDENGRISGTSPMMSSRYESSALYKDKDGRTVFPLGTYRVTEMVPPEGYTLSSEVLFMTVREDGTDKPYTSSYITVKASDRAVRGGVKVLKNDSVTGRKAQGDAVLKGAEFTIINKSDGPVYIGDSSYAPGKAVMTITSDNEGKASTGPDALPFGSYSVKETKAPEGYLLNEDWSRDFRITEEGKIVDITDKPVRDTVIKGGLKVIKNDSELKRGDPQGDATLKGAEFTVYNRSGKSVIVEGKEYQHGDAVMTIKTGDDGKAETGQVLPYGTYLVKETKAPAGYLLNEAWSAEASIRKDKTTVELDSKVRDSVMRGGVRLSKTDCQFGEAYPQGDGALEGAEFTITNESGRSVFVDGRECAPGDAVKVITTDQNGFAATEEKALPFGTYSVRETKAPEGYLINDTWGRTFKIRKDGQMADLTEYPSEEPVIRSGVQIMKADCELDRSEAMGGATLEGITMTVRNESAHDVAVRAELGKGDPIDWSDREAVRNLFETGVIRRVGPGEDIGEITIGWNEEKQAYTTETLPDDLPYGTYSIRESKTNSSYQRTDRYEHWFEVREDGKVYSYEDDDEAYVFRDQVYRSDVQGTKIGDSTSERFSLVPFKIISVSTGETHVVVTDRNGFFSTKDRRPRGEFDEEENKDTQRKINPFDDLLEAEEITEKMMSGRYDDVRMGVWFGKGEFGSEAMPSGSECVKSLFSYDLGALPYGSYILEEMKCERNEGFTLQRFFFTVDEKSVCGNIDLETITDDVPELWTSALADGRRENAKTGETVTIKDKVEYRNLTRGEEYTLEGILMDKETGEALTDSKGELIMGEKTFDAHGTSGREEVKFELDSTGLEGKDTVIFEKLYDSEGNLIARHEDLEDKNQTIEWEEPEEPGEPSEPDVPGEPDKPDEPAKPDKPVAPSVQGKPDKPVIVPEKEIPAVPAEKPQARPVLREKRKVPKTGDDTSYALWIALMGLAIGGSAGLMCLKKRR